jgi:hypothetical protein
MSTGVMTKIDYEILAVAFEEQRHLAHQGLQILVQGYLRDGWEPLGAPFLNADMIYQALVRRPPTKPDSSSPQGEERKTTYAEKKQFSERFSNADWLVLCRHADFVDALGRSIPDAEVVALRVLSGSPQSPRS